MRRHAYGILVAFICAATASAGVTRAEPTFEPGFDRTGGDYGSLQIPRPRPRLCQDACLRDDRCKAWVFVRPGVLGPVASCWFKDSIPELRRSDCCVSGVK